MGIGYHCIPANARPSISEESSCVSARYTDHGRSLLDIVAGWREWVVVRVTGAVESHTHSLAYTPVCGYSLLSDLRERVKITFMDRMLFMDRIFSI